MALTYRAAKGTPLTIEELDQNFLELDKRLSALEKGSKPFETVTQVKQEGEAILFIGTQGHPLGKVHLPRLPFQPKGIWTAKTPYQQGDVVSYQKSMLFCQKSHQKEVFDPLDWVILMSA